AASYDNVTTIPESSVWLEGSRRSFKRCLDVLLRDGYEGFDRIRAAEEGELLGGPGIEALCRKMESVLEKNSPIQATPEIECRIVDRIAPRNDRDYKTVVDVGQGEYCFDPAKTKRAEYAWPGIE